MMRVCSSWLLFWVAAGVFAASPTTGSVAPNTAHAVGFYDASLQRVVLIGSDAPPTDTDRDRVWSWSGRRWESLPAVGPVSRANAAAAYDQRRRVAVVAGGARRVAGGTRMLAISDTWERRDDGWQPIAGTEFDPRDHHSMVYDETRQSVVLFGGIPGDRSAQWPADTWQLSDAGWRSLQIEGPPGRARSAMAYDRRRKHVVLFGGVGPAPGPQQPQPFLQDTWILEGDRWRQAAASGPPARYAHGMVFDERAGVVLLYSGAAAHRDAPLTDMWQWDGVRWTEIALTGATPGYRYQPVMVYDARRRTTVLYGGLQSASHDTWEWDGRRWREIVNR